MTETAERMTEAGYGLEVTRCTTIRTPIGWSMYMAQLLDPQGRPTGLVQYQLIRDHPELGTDLDAAGEVVVGKFLGPAVQEHWLVGKHPKFPGLIGQYQRRQDDALARIEYIPTQGEL